jgi:hypothetical protein
MLAVGAILRFAIATTATDGINLRVIGDILIAVGVVGLIIWLIVWAPRARNRRSSYPPPPPLDEGERAAYRSEQRYGRY